MSSCNLAHRKIVPDCVDTMRPLHTFCVAVDLVLDGDGPGLDSTKTIITSTKYKIIERL